jgi:hypothetical protein
MLFTTLDQIRTLIPVSSGTDIARLAPHLESAEQDFIRPLLGPDLFLQLQNLASGITSAESDEDSLAQLLSLIRRSEIHLAYWQGYDVLNAYISDGGFRRIDSEKIKGLFKYQEDNLREYFKVSGFNGLDSALEFIEDHLSDFPAFLDSETWQGMKSSFFPGTGSFNKIYFIGNSRLTFLRMQAYFPLITDMHIKPILGEENLSLILSEMLRDLPETKVAAIIPFIRKPMAFLSVAMLMEESGADITERGLYFEGRTASVLSNIINRPAAEDRIASLVKRNKGLGEAYLNDLRRYLIDKAADWGGISTPPAGLHNRDNKDKRTFWA